MKTYIIHVKGAEERKVHIDKQLLDKDKDLDIEFINEGNKEELNDEILQKYFIDNIRETLSDSEISCALKHILAYERIINNQNKYALIFEDDIFIRKFFSEGINKIIQEIEKNGLSNILISIEDSNLNFIKGSELISNKFLYQKLKGRMAGAYLIDLNCAKSMVEFIKQIKCTIQIDWFHNICAENGIIKIFWSMPALANQASLSGKLNSLLNNKKGGIYNQAKFFISRIYKKILYSLR
jgi:glycosyl transferase family 25